MTRTRLVLLLVFMILFLSVAGAADDDVKDRLKTSILMGELDKADEGLKEYVKAYPHDPDAYYLKFLLFRKRDNKEEAVQALKKALSINPGSVQYQLALADLYFENGENRDALEAYEKLRNEGEKTAHIYGRLGQLYQRMNNFEKARVCFKLAIEKEPETFRYYLMLAESCQEMDLYDEAAESLRNAVELGAKDKDIYYSLALACEEMGNTDEAIKVYNEIAVEFPQETEPYRALSRLYRARGETLKSIESWLSFSFDGMTMDQLSFLLIGLMLAMILFFYPPFAPFILSIFMLPVVLGAGGLQRVDWLEKISNLAAVFELDHIVFLCNYMIVLIEPDKPVALSNMGKYHERYGRLDKAMHYYGRSLEVKPDMAETLFSIGVVNQMQGKHKESELMLKKALEKESSNFLYWFHLAMSYYSQEMFKEAEESAHRTLELNPDFEPALKLYVDAGQSTGNLDECLSFLSDLYDKAPERFKICTEIGNVLIITGRARESLQYLEEALDADPGSPEAWYNISIAQRETGQLEKSEESMRKALELSPNSPWLYTAYALALRLNKKNREAESALKNVLFADPASSYGNYLLGLIIRDRDKRRSLDYLKKSLKSFEKELELTKKPWLKANEYECMAKTHKLLDDGEKSGEAYNKAIQYASVTPENLYIFSESKMKLVKPEEFIKECKKELNTEESEESPDLEDDDKIS